MALLNLKRAEVEALVDELKDATSRPIVSVRRKLEQLQLPAEPIAEQMDVYECIEEVSR